MTFERFKEIWDSIPWPTAEEIYASAKAKGQTVLVDEGCGPETQEALIAASNGDFSHFDRIQHLLEKYDSQSNQPTTG